MIIYITGTLPGISRNEAADRIRDLGAKVTSAVSKNTDYLIAGEKAGSKLTKANELGVRVLTPDDLAHLLKGELP